MALFVGLQWKGRLGGVLGFSGFLPKEIKIPLEMCPVLAVHGTKDIVIKCDPAVRSYKRENFDEKLNVKLVVVEGMDHSFHPPAIELLKEFMEAALK